MDTFLQVAICLCIIPCIFFSIKKTGNLINPITLMTGLFFVPMFFATFRLSGLQGQSWDYNTYITLISTIGTWLIFPTIIIIVFHKSGTITAPTNKERFLKTYRIFSITVVTLYLVGNYVQSGLIFPIIEPNTAFIIHDEFPGGIRFFARATPAAAILAYIAFYHYRSKIDITLFAILLLTPLSRLSRIDPAISLIAITCLYPIAPLFKKNLRNHLAIGVSAIAMLLAASELGNQRQNRFGEYEFKYAEMIKWKTTHVGPSEILPVLYGYTSLSFENLDATITKHNENFTYVLYSFDWLFSGFLKLNWITPYEQARAENAQREIVSTAATVPTALFPFYNDFGPIGIMIPCLIYMSALLYFYCNKNSSTFACLYALYAGAFGLASFQALVASGPLIQQLAWISIIFWVSSRTPATRKNANFSNIS